MPYRVVILASGAGSLAQAVIDADELDCEVVAVISDRDDAQALDRAKEAGIATEHIPMESLRERWNAQVIEKVAAINLIL